MATIPYQEAAFDPAAPPAEPMKRWTVEEYHELIRLGVLTEEDPYELIEGWLVTKMTKNPPHEFVVSYLNQSLVKALPENWSCRVQCALTLKDGEPEPDIAIVSGTQFDYRARHPHAKDVALLIEVSDRTLHRDRGIKLRSYARAGIGEYWIVNLPEEQIEVYTRPARRQKQPAYAACQVYKKGETAPLNIGGQPCLKVAVDELC